MSGELETNVIQHIKAGFSGIWIRTAEPDLAIQSVFHEVRRYGDDGNPWGCAYWDCRRGIAWSDSKGGLEQNDSLEARDPIGGMAAAFLAMKKTAKVPRRRVLLMNNLHFFLGSPEMIQETQNQVISGRSDGETLIVVAPKVALPLELEKLFVVLEHALPGQKELEAIGVEVAGDGAAKEFSATSRPAVLSAAAGLTRYEAEGAFGLALARNGKIGPETVWEIKSGMLKKSGMLQLHRGGERFADLGGLDALKGFCAKALHRHTDGDAKPRGVLLLSPPGCGKSAFCKALGNEVGRPTIILDAGRLMGSLVGETEENTRRALAIADAMAPCILMVDEIEKALAGASGSGNLDSGVSARMFGALLTWLNDHESDVYFVATSNDIAKLPPEFTRAERFDGVFFVDLPTADERKMIWKMYLKKYSITDKFGTMDAVQCDDGGWTGAEIKACCRLAAMLGVSLGEAAKYVVPVSRTAGTQIEGLRTWADGRCLSASDAGVYRKDAGEEKAQRRDVIRAGR